MDRILRQMTAHLCGPFFTVAPTGANGGGLVNLAVNMPGRVQVVTLP
jgi:hypothetical protein